MPSVGEQIADLREPLEAAGEEHYAALEAAYRTQLRSCVRQVVDRFQRITTLQASAAWTPPSMADVFDIQVQTAAIRRGQAAMVGAMAGILEGLRVTTPGGQTIGVSFSPIAAFPQKMLDQLGVRAAQLDQAIREPVAAAVARGWAEGASVPRTAKYIRESAGAVVNSQATMLARTDLVGMSNGSSSWMVQEVNAASEKAGGGKIIGTKTWSSAHDARVRDTHAIADGQTVPIDQPYSIGGSPMAYPGDPSGPNAETCNCRCTEYYNETTRPAEAKSEPEPQLVQSSGKNVGQLFRTPKTAKPEIKANVARISDAVDILDDVMPGPVPQQTIDHLTAGGAPPELQIRLGQTPGELGHYRYAGRSPVNIEINPRDSDIFDTVVHEIGHYIDHQVLGEVGEWTSETASTGAMMRFREAAAATRNIQDLKQAQYGGMIPLREGGYAPLSADGKQLVDYLLDPTEMWARAFSQYITKRHADSDARRAFESSMRSAKASRAALQTQWDDDDFDALGDAVEGVLVEAGLMEQVAALAAAALAAFHAIDPRALAPLDRGLGLDGLLTGELQDGHQELDGVVLVPVDPLGLREFDVDHRSHPTSVRAAQRADGAGVAFQDSPEEDSMSVTAEAAVDDSPAVGASWWSDIAYEGLSTGDGRYIADGALAWRDPPLTLMAMVETTEGGHLGAQVAGRMDTFDKLNVRITGEKLPVGVHSVRSTGVFDMGEYGQDIERMVDSGVLTGVSVDLSIQEWALRDPDTGEIVQPDDATDEQWERAMMGEMEFAITQAEVMAATVCPTPAFADAKIALTASADRPNVAGFWRASDQGARLLGVEPGQLMTTLTASLNFGTESLQAAADAPVSPINPPRQVFNRPEPDHLVPLTIDGYEVYGHLASFDSCHVGLINGAWSQCVTPPKSASGYAHFHASGSVETAEGDIVPIGKLMISDAGHAPTSGSPAQARRFYDKNGAAGAYVRMIDGKHGPWFSGQLRPGITREEIATLRANAQSGDWRGTSPHDLELIASVTVPVPGYGIVPSQLALAASADGSLYVSALILTSDIEAQPIGETPEGRAAAALMDGGTDALHEMISG